MSRVYKYELPGEHITLQLPLGFKVIKAGVQSGTVVVWAIVHTESPLVPVDFAVVFTGEDMPPGDWVYIETVFVDRLVLHIFRRAELSEVKS